MLVPRAPRVGREGARPQNRRSRRGIGVPRNQGRRGSPINSPGPFVSFAPADSCFPKSIDVRRAREIEFLPPHDARPVLSSGAARRGTLACPETREKANEDVEEYGGGRLPGEGGPGIENAHAISYRRRRAVANTSKNRVSPSALCG